MSWKPWFKTALKGPRADPWSTWIALWAIGTATLFFLDAVLPDEWFNPATPLDRGLPAWIVLIDAAFYALGGILVVGALTASRLAANARKPINVEQVGWILIITAATANMGIILAQTPNWVLTVSWTLTVILGGAGRYAQLSHIEQRAEQVANILTQVRENSERIGGGSQ